jgi:hypothetical protein
VRLGEVRRLGNVVQYAYRERERGKWQGLDMEGKERAGKKETRKIGRRPYRGNDIDVGERLGLRAVYVPPGLQLENLMEVRMRG